MIRKIDGSCVRACACVLMSVVRAFVRVVIWALQSYISVRDAVIS